MFGDGSEIREQDSCVRILKQNLLFRYGAQRRSLLLIGRPQYISVFLRLFIHHYGGIRRENESTEQFSLLYIQNINCFYYGCMAVLGG